jgi:hypothetical protein
MNKFASLSAADRAVVLRETAVRTGIGSPAVVEKDFWVCWTLGQIFRSRFISAKKSSNSMSELLREIRTSSQEEICNAN